jgi:hypothetical protein
MDKVNDIGNTITDAVKSLCKCNDPIIQGTIGLVCVDKSTVIFYGSVAEKSVLGNIETRVAQTDEIRVSGTKLFVDENCPVLTEDIPSTRCKAPSSGEQKGGNGAAVAAPLVIILILLVAGAALLVGLYLFWRKRAGKSVPFSIRADDESPIISYDGHSETVSLSEGAELRAVHKPTLAFDEKQDLSAAESSTTIGSENRNLQNPIYSTPGLNSAPMLTTDRTLYNPVYETVSADLFDAKPAAEDDVPEKVMPSPEDFKVPDDAKPLVATTTATGTTTVHSGGGKYEPSAVVPMDIQGEPQYATVLPKHLRKAKKATAKPFAADGEDSDGD